MPSDSLATPVLEIGGTHVTAALVELYDADATVPVSVRLPLDAAAPADAILDTLADAARALGDLPGELWGVATPGPFDYDRGIARFAGVGKFDALNGVDVGAALAERLAPAPPFPSFVFLNDAAAFALGEWFAGAARGARRAVCVTLGTGTGGCFLADGVPVTDGDEVPPLGVLHLLRHGGVDLEEHCSRRALMAAYAAAGGRADADVADIARAARAGEAAADAAFAHYYRVLGEALEPWLARFGAEALVVGGSIARSWDLLERHLPVLPCPVRPAQLADAGPLVGAAHRVAGGGLRPARA